MKIRIGLFTGIFIALLVLAIMGKSSFWHVVLFPFYLAGALLGSCFGFVIFIAIICLIIWIVWFFFLR